jgi:hypothetical protein
MKEPTALKITALWLGLVSMVTAALVWVGATVVYAANLTYEGDLEKTLATYFTWAAIGVALYGSSQWAGAWMLGKGKKQAKHLLIWPSVVFLLWPVPIVVQALYSYITGATALMLAGGWIFFALFFGWYIYRAFRL